MILVLTQDGAELQFELALLGGTSGTHRNPFAFVEFLFGYLLDASLQVYDALFEHAQPTLAR